MAKGRAGEGAEGERAGRQEEEVGLPRGQAGLGRLLGQGSARSKAGGVRGPARGTGGGRGEEVGPRSSSVLPPGSSLAVVRRLVSPGDSAASQGRESGPIRFIPTAACGLPQGLERGAC